MSQSHSPVPSDSTPPAEGGSAGGAGGGGAPGASHSSPPPPPPYAYPPPQPPKRGGTLLRVVTSGAVLSILIASLLANVYLGGLLFSLAGGPSQMVYQPGDEGQRIVILPVTGMIGGDTADFVRRCLRQLEDDPPDAIVLRVNSGGGGVSPSDRIWHYLRRYRREHSQVPVVASFGDYAASGGYYISMPADHIVAEPTCVTGSIGVMAPAFTIGELLDKIGVKPEILVARQSPKKEVANDITHPFQEEDREAILQLLNHAYARFLKVVVQGRTDPNDPKAPSPEQIKAVADGRTFTAKAAKEHQLVDSVGYLDQAIHKAAALAKLPADANPQVMRFQESSGFGLLGLLGMRGTRSTPKLELDPSRARAWLEEMTTPRLQYRIHLRR